MGYRQVWVDGTHIQSLRKVDGLRTLMESCLAIPMRDALSNIGHDYSCDDNQYAFLNVTTCQLHIVHQGGLGQRRSSHNLGGGKRRELSFIHSKLNALSSFVRIEQKSVQFLS